MTDDQTNGPDGRRERINILKEVGRPVFVEVDLDALSHNVKILRSRCHNHTGMISVVKAGAYGHGSVMVSRHLKSIGVERLAVATVDEGLHLRKHGIKGPIHIFGNTMEWEMLDCVQFNLTPTTSTEEAVRGMYQAVQECAADSDDPKSKLHLDNNISSLPCGAVNIKIDSGMSRNGCQPKDLETIVKLCDEYHLPIDGMMTHFADSWENEDFTKAQFQTFLDAVQPYRSRGIKLHVANSGAVLSGVGTDLDFIRPGIALYGLPPGGNLDQFKSFGFKPIASVQGVPTLVKQLEEGRSVGYSGTHTTTEKEWVATIPLGYADGYWRHLSSLGVVIRNKTGAKCPVIGRVSMDAITVQVPQELEPYETFTLMSADFDQETSATGIAEHVGTIAYEVGTRLSVRYPRVYLHGKSRVVVPALSTESY